MNKDKLLQIRVDEEFLSKLDYLREINGYKTVAETVRKIVEKEFRKEQNNCDFERASDMRDYCEHWEPTYNPDDGSM